MTFLQSCENFKVTVSGANSGGLTFTMGGLPAFVPVSQLAKKADRTWWTQDVSIAYWEYYSQKKKFGFKYWLEIKSSHNYFQLLQEMGETFIGHDVSVAILEVSQEGNKIVCSITRAEENDKMRRLEARKKSKIIALNLSSY